MAKDATVDPKAAQTQNATVDPKAAQKGKAAAGTASTSNGKSKAKKAQADSADNFLSAYRPKQRFVVFGGFLAICLSIAFFYDTCDVRKKKQDCGYSGVTALECQTVACFSKGGGEMEKKKITLKRKKGTKLGLVAGPKKDDSEPVFIKGIKEGAVADHNAEAEAEDQIHPRDTIMSIDGASGKSLRKSLAATNTEKVVIELRRSKLPSYLMWLHGSSKPSRLETLLTSLGTRSFLATFSKLGGAGFGFWLLSGYPPASLPLYYFGLSGAVSWHMSRCCHNSEVAAGVPHCYRGGSAKLSVTMNRLQTRGGEILAKARKDPRAYLKAWFWSPEFAKWL